MRAPLDLRRVAAMTLMLAIAAAAFVVAPRRPSTPPLAAPRPWIALPPAGMDARLPDVRAALLRVAEGRYPGDPQFTGRPLVAMCGRPPNEQALDRYHLRVDAGYVASPMRREVDIVVDGEWADVHIEDVSIPPPPDVSKAAIEWMTPAVGLHVRLAALEPLRRAWDTAAWRGPQRPAGCLDIATAELEACVDGRYAARMLDCHGAPAVTALLRAVQSMPAPPPGYWETARR